MARRITTRPRKQASQERSRATIDAILDATARVLVKHGYDHASTNKVAEAAGVSIGSLYQYFPSKEALVAGVISRHISQVQALVEASFERLFALPVRQAARELVTLMIEVHRVDPKLHRVLVEQAPRVGDMSQIEQLDERSTVLVRMYLEAHRDEIGVTDLDLASFNVVTCAEALTHIAVLRRPELISDPRFIDEVTAVIVRYLEGDTVRTDRAPKRRALRAQQPVDAGSGVLTRLVCDVQCR